MNECWSFWIWSRRESRCCASEYNIFARQYRHGYAYSFSCQSTIAQGRLRYRLRFVESRTFDHISMTGTRSSSWHHRQPRICQVAFLWSQTALNPPILEVRLNLYFTRRLPAWNSSPPSLPSNFCHPTGQEETSSKYQAYCCEYLSP